MWQLWESNLDLLFDNCSIISNYPISLYIYFMLLNIVCATYLLTRCLTRCKILCALYTSSNKLLLKMHIIAKLYRIFLKLFTESIFISLIIIYILYL